MNKAFAAGEDDGVCPLTARPAHKATPATSHRHDNGKDELWVVISVIALGIIYDDGPGKGLLISFQQSQQHPFGHGVVVGLGAVHVIPEIQLSKHDTPCAVI